MHDGMQVDVLVDRLRKVEAQIAQKERVAGTDLATLKVAVLFSCIQNHTALQAVLTILELVLLTPCMQMLDLIFCFETLAIVTRNSCLVSVAQTSCLCCLVWFDAGADALAAPAASSTSKHLPRLLCHIYRCLMCTQRRAQKKQNSYQNSECLMTGDGRQSPVIRHSEFGLNSASSVRVSVCTRNISEDTSTMTD